jgi:hypothetical protein
MTQIPIKRAVERLPGGVMGVPLPAAVVRHGAGTARRGAARKPDA